MIAAPDSPSVAGVPRLTDILDGSLDETLCPRSRGRHQ